MHDSSSTTADTGADEESAPAAAADDAAAGSAPRSSRLPSRLIEELGLRLGVHDLSRIEWTVSAPLPDTGKLRYTVELEADLPEAMYVPHNVWAQLQSYTRLQSPSEDAGHGGPALECDELDELRRDTLGIVHLIKVNRQHFERTAAAAAGHLVSALDPGLPRELSSTVEQTLALVGSVRRELGRAASRGESALHKEWLLVDEFVSHQLLEFLLRCQRAVKTSVLGISSRMHEVGTDFAEALLVQIGAALKDEMQHRKKVGFVVPRAETSDGVAMYVERAGQLKRHFEDVLFLETESYMVDSKVATLTALAGAALAGALWVVYTLLPVSSSTRTGLGLGTFTVIFALAYALRDRAKEVVRQWLAVRLVQLYGQRSLKLRLPQKLDAEQAEIVEAQEHFGVESSEVDDALNQHVGRTRKVVRLRYRMHATLSPAPTMKRSGVGRVKHIYRYDLAPLFSRLDSSLRRVPVMSEAGEVAHVEAPKEYRVPVRLVVRLVGKRNAPRYAARETAGELVVSRRGIERLEPHRPPPTEPPTRQE